MTEKSMPQHAAQRTMAHLGKRAAGLRNAKVLALALLLAVACIGTAGCQGTQQGAAGGEVAADIAISRLTPIPLLTEENRSAIAAKIEAETGAVAWAGGIRTLSLSPDGKTIFGSGERHFFACDRSGENIRVIAPDGQRGTEDTRDQLGELLAMGSAGLVEGNGCHWSPDGRYLTLTYPAQVITQGKAFGLPLVDTQEGIVFLVAASPVKNVTEEGAVLPYQAAFSADGKTLYDVRFEGGPERSGGFLWQYDIQTGDSTRLVTATEYDEDSQRMVAMGGEKDLALLPDGRLAQTIYPYSAKDTAGLYIYGQNGGKWQRQEVPVPVYALENARGYFDRVQISPVSNYGLAGYAISGFDMVAVSRFDISNGFAGLDEVLVIRDFQQKKAESMPLSQLFAEEAAAFKNCFPTIANLAGEKVTKEDLESAAVQVMDFCISPDGKQALLLGMSRRLSGPQVWGMLRMDMDTLALTPVDIDDEQMVQNHIFRHGSIRWLAGGEVLTTLRQEGVQLYAGSVAGEE